MRFIKLLTVTNDVATLQGLEYLLLDFELQILQKCKISCFNW